MSSTVTGPGASWFAAAAAADAMLRALGGTEVMVSVPVASATADATGGLGMEAGATQDLVLGPVLVRRCRDGVGVELLVAAEALRAALSLSRDQRPEDVLAKEARVTVNQVSLRILSMEAEYFGGLEYLYRIRLED